MQTESGDGDNCHSRFSKTSWLEATPIIAGTICLPTYDARTGVSRRLVELPIDRLFSPADWRRRTSRERLWEQGAAGATCPFESYTAQTDVLHHRIAWIRMPTARTGNKTTVSSRLSVPLQTAAPAPELSVVVVFSIVTGSPVCGSFCTE